MPDNLERNPIEQDHRGRFAKGNRGGPGRPKQIDWGAWKTRNAPELMALADKLLAQAQDGCLSSAKLLLDRLWPVQSAANEALRLEVEELQLRLDAALERTAQ